MLDREIDLDRLTQLIRKGADHLYMHLSKLHADAFPLASLRIPKESAELPF